MVFTVVLPEVAQAVVPAPVRGEGPVVSSFPGYSLYNALSRAVRSEGVTFPASNPARNAMLNSSNRMSRSIARISRRFSEAKSRSQNWVNLRKKKPWKTTLIQGEHHTMQCIVLNQCKCCTISIEGSTKSLLSPYQKGVAVPDRILF